VSTSENENAPPPRQHDFVLALEETGALIGEAVSILGRLALRRRSDFRLTTAAVNVMHDELFAILEELNDRKTDATS